MGFLLPEVVENILFSLGTAICRRVVEDLVDKVIDLESGRVEYQKLINQGLLSNKL